MAKTRIEWTDRAWNPTTGCTKVSAGCKHCYAEVMAQRLKAMGSPHYKNGFEVEVHPDALGLPLHWKKPQRIFVNSMSDLFHKDIALEFICKVFAVMGQAKQHIFQILTKRHERLAEISPRLTWWSNIHMLVSVEDQENADKRIPHLLQCGAAVRGVSLEPLLGPVQLAHYMPAPVGHIERYRMPNWVIVGGESGPGARPFDPDWARDVLKQCRAAGVPFFMKQINKRIPIPDDLMVREFPKAGGAA